MEELYFTEAVILDREEGNGFDSRYSIYAKGFGKINAKSESARKIISKLAGHLEPGSLVKVRLVGNGSYKLVEALKYGQTLTSPPDLHFLNQLLPEGDFDFQIWTELMDGSLTNSHFHQNISLVHSSKVFSWKRILKILGWDPDYAICQVCQKEKVDRFSVRDQSFYCDQCGSELTNYISVL